MLTFAVIATSLAIFTATAWLLLGRELRKAGLM